MDVASVIETAGMVAVALIGVSFGLQKVLKGWKESNAENSVVSIMHRELERMSQQNTLLSNEIGNLQQQLVKLNRELLQLTKENQRLQSEVGLLTDEIATLKTILPHHNK
jgi:peptidoglycan hydrolase CwlO-like protein